MPALIPFIPLIAAGVGAGTAAYGGYQAAQGSDDQPDPMLLAKQQSDAADKSRLQSVVGRGSRDALTRTSGSVGPDFLANLATQEAGTPNLQGDALDMVKKMLAGQS